MSMVGSYLGLSVGYTKFELAVMFASISQCYKCGVDLPRMYRDPDYCVPCDTDIRRRLQQWGQINFGQAVDMWFRQQLSEFLAYDARHLQRLHYLHRSLVAGTSCFRRFTFFWGGKSGNISQREDVLDRIMSFLR